MANSKKRCTVCRYYFPAGDMRTRGVTSVCIECESVPQDIKTKPTKPKRTRTRGKGASSHLKRHVRNRDHGRCRWCRKATLTLECHHIKYLSQGGLNEPSNLIALCDQHHQKAHSNKRIWMPVLLACIWMHYVEGKFLTIPEVEEQLRHRGIHPEQEELAK